MEDCVSIRYVLAAYFGDRPRAAAVGPDPYMQVASVVRHLRSLTRFRCPAIADVLVVINADSNELDAEAIGIEARRQAGAACPPVEVVTRPNCGYSYGAWQEGVVRSHDADVTHFFLIEDDYLPAADLFYLPFLRKFDERTGFVASSFAHFPGTIPANADVPSGLLSASAARDVLSRLGQLFAICDLPLGAGDYALGCENQITFLAPMLECGFLVRSIQDRCSVPFHWFDDEVVERGVVGKPCMLRPQIGSEWV